MTRHDTTYKVAKGTPSATEKVLDHILVELDEGRISAGQRVNASRIAATLGLSVAPVREALAILAGQGVLELHQDRGAILSEMTSREVILLWEVLNAIARVGIKRAAHAVKRGDDQELLLSSYAKICEAGTHTPAITFFQILDEWHIAANAMGGNELVSRSMTNLGMRFWHRYLAQLIDVSRFLQQYKDNYRRMHEAVLAGDAETAASAFDFHTQWSISMIEANVEKRPKRRRT